MMEADGINADTMSVTLNEIKKQYIQTNGTVLSDDAVRSEPETKYLERLFTDERTVNRPAVEKPTVFMKIKEWVEDAIIRFKGTAAEKQLIKTRELYVKTARRGQDNFKFQPVMMYSAGDNYDNKNESSTKIINKSDKNIPADFSYHEWEEKFTDKNELTNSGNDDIMGMKGRLSRKEKNTGVFADLKIPLQKDILLKLRINII